MGIRGIGDVHYRDCGSRQKLPSYDDCTSLTDACYESSGSDVERLRFSF